MHFVLISNIFFFLKVFKKNKTIITIEKIMINFVSFISFIYYELFQNN